MSSYDNISTSFFTQIIIRIVLISLLVANYFFTIPIINDIQIYLLIYLGFLLIVSPIINHVRNPEKMLQEEPIRKKFVTAQEELDKAVEIAADFPEDAMMYVRTAIDLSIKAKFGFKKIITMGNFFNDADRLDLPLPSYSLIYMIFNEGSKRLHDGKVHTPFEASEAIDMVTDFIAELEEMKISQVKIDEFKSKCKFVE